MMREVKTFGFNRQKLVPLLDSTAPRVCGRCDQWFAARKRERVCDGCSPAKTRTQRALRYSHPRTASIRGKRAGSDGVKMVFSEVLGLTFTCPLPTLAQHR